VPRRVKAGHINADGARDRIRVLVGQLTHEVEAIRAFHLVGPDPFEVADVLERVVARWRAPELDIDLASYQRAMAPEDAALEVVPLENSVGAAGPPHHVGDRLLSEAELAEEGGLEKDVKALVEPD
jgi:hypothetical protein